MPPGWVFVDVPEQPTDSGASRPSLTKARGQTRIENRMPKSDWHCIGVVAIGRNEGERLRRCLASLPAGVGGVVYVDSGSTDGSTQLARSHGSEVVELDLSIPFTAARARNAGLGRLQHTWSGIEFVQFVDGDCLLVAGWLQAAIEKMATDPTIAVVCGRRREIAPQTSAYNRLIDMEWDTPIGEAQSCGGDALMRVAAISEAGGYDETVIAGEEPELCARLRARGWRVFRIDHDMTLHDAALTRFWQWWTRAVRGGHAYAEVHAKHSDLWRRENYSLLAWGVILPVATVALALETHGLGLLLLAAYPALWLRISWRRRRRGDAFALAALYAASCVLWKFPGAIGWSKYWWNRVLGRKAGLIEYKGPQNGTAL
jgi:GT2 family glycosyltransferase